MAIPKCQCTTSVTIKEGSAVAIQNPGVIHCNFHKAAAELYELVDALTMMREQSTTHERCRCFHCRCLKALEKARAR